MIGRLSTTHPTEGYGIVVGYTKVDKQVTITSITTFSGKDVWGNMTSSDIQELKKQIPL